MANVNDILAKAREIAEIERALENKKEEMEHLLTRGGARRMLREPGAKKVGWSGKTGWNMREAIRDYLSKHKGEHAAQELIAALGVPDNRKKSMYANLSKMVRSGQIFSAGAGRYTGFGNKPAAPIRRPGRPRGSRSKKRN